MSMRKTAMIVMGALVMSNALGASDKPMEACMAAFAADSLPKDHPVRFERSDLSAGSMEHAEIQRITLTAKGARTGRDFGTATCVVSEAGEVLSLSPKRTKLATLAASQSVAAH